VTSALSVLLSRAEMAATARSIEACQGRNGMIAWFPGGHGDPWNHVEAAMALDVAGHHEAARAAYTWSLDSQAADGSWHAYYLPEGGVEESRRDTNATAYLATGLWHHLVATGDRAFVSAALPAVAAATSFVLSHQREGGEVIWSVESDGRPAAFALLAASSSVFASLVAAERLSRVLDRPIAGLGGAAARLAAALVDDPGLFSPREEYAMDWYYPVLAGALTGAAARARLAAGRDLFATSTGVLCRSDRRWVTTAESAECAMAHVRAGEVATAHRLLATTVDKRRADGSYLTGLVYPERSEFPPGEASSYSAAAVVLATDLLAKGAATTAVFAPEPSLVAAPGTRTSTRRLRQSKASSATNRPVERASR
jgi:hypothetical protein